jgi:hypothetical protein
LIGDEDSTAELRAAVYMYVEDTSAEGRQKQEKKE